MTVCVLISVIVCVCYKDWRRSRENRIMAQSLWDVSHTCWNHCPTVRTSTETLGCVQKSVFLRKTQSDCVCVCFTCETLRGALRRVSVPSVGSVVINMSDLSLVFSLARCVCVLVCGN